MTQPGCIHIKVLVVEDSPTQAALIERLLQDLGYETTLAEDGQKGLEAVRRDRPAVVISDVKMPVMDGFELCRTLKGDQALRDIPVILLTSLSEPADLLLSIEAGADFHIPKPYNDSYLSAKVAEVLARSAAGPAAPAADGNAMVFDGKSYNIAASREHILRLLFATYEVASLQNRQLQEARDDQRALNDKLTDSMASLMERTNQLETANKELEAFSYSVSHDLRAPLRAIVGFADVLRQEYADRLDSEGRRYLNIVIDNTRKMGVLIDDILTLSRLGRRDMRMLPVAIDRLARETFRERVLEYPDRKIELKIGPLPMAMGDASLLRQAMTNLIGNALKFTATRETAVIEVGARAEGGRVAYFVRDNGVGFNMKYVEKLFGVFQRLHGPEFEGTGIGLAIVARVIKRHGGDVWAEGKPNEGATFYFTLPTTSAAPGAGPDPATDL